MTFPHYDRPHGWMDEDTAVRYPVTPAHRRLDPADPYPQDAYLHTAPIVTGPPDPYQLDEAVTERMTVDEPLRDPLQPQPMDPSAYDELKAKFEAAAGRPSIFLHELSPPATMELIKDPNTPPWGWLDTFLRRGIHIAAFLILWTMIVVGVFAGAAIVNAVNNLGDTSTVDETGIPPGVDLLPECDATGSNPDLPAC